MEHIIPDSFFSTLTSIWLLVISAAAIAHLALGADWVVDHAAKLAYALGIPKIIVGATIVSLGTTAPEAAVSVLAAWGGNSGLALGNSVGSVICDTALIFGFCCLLTKIPVNRYVLNRQGWLQLISSLLLYLVCLLAWFFNKENPTIPQWIGGLFLILLSLYLFISVQWAKKYPEKDKNKPTFTTQEVVISIGLLFIGLAIVLLASRFLIGSVTELAVRWEVPDAVIAATLVAFGTSLPELVTALTSIRKGHTDLLVGNIVGADILNILFVTGAAAVVAPLPIPNVFFSIHLPIMMVTLILFRIFISISRDTFQRWMGAPLLLIYIFYVVYQYTNPL